MRRSPFRPRSSGADDMVEMKIDTGKTFVPAQRRRRE